MNQNTIIRAKTSLDELLDHRGCCFDDPSWQNDVISLWDHATLIIDLVLKIKKSQNGGQS